MSYRDRYDARDDRNDGRSYGRDESYLNSRERDEREWRDWDHRSQWDRGRDYTRAEREPQPQHYELRSQGGGFRDDDYGRNDAARQRDYDRYRDAYYGRGSYTGPTGTYLGDRDQREDRNDWFDTWSARRRDDGNAPFRHSSNHEFGPQPYDWRGTREPAYANRGRTPFGQPQTSYARHANFANLGARQFEYEDARHDDHGRHEDSFGQELQDAGRYVVRSVKRVFRGPKGYRRSDERIREDVNDRLAQQEQIDPSDIEVQVQNGEVTLTGTVQSRHEKFVAEEISDDVSGVRDVHNQLRVKRKEEAVTTSATTSLGNNEMTPRVRNGHV